MDKNALVSQLHERLTSAARQARRSGEDAAEEARSGVSPQERSLDTRVAIESASLARGQAQRLARLTAEASLLDGFRPAALAPRAPIQLGAVVEVEGDEGGRTFFLAPSGAGEELTGPDGDGILSVVTPSSPVGRAVLGKRVGDTVDVTVQGDVVEWTITFVC